MHPPHRHRTAFMGDRGDGLKVKFWYILERMRVKHWGLAVGVLAFVKRRINIIHQRESSFYVGIHNSGFDFQGVIKKYHISLVP